LREAAALLWAAEGHAEDSVPPPQAVAAARRHPALAPAVRDLAGSLGRLWTEAAEGRALWLLLPGCPREVVLPTDCPWHVQPDGTVTKTVLADDGQGGRQPKEQRVLPTVVLPLDQEWALVPWGLPSAGEVMVGQEYAWWRRHEQGGGEWVVGQSQAVGLWDRRRLTALADAGVPVDSENASELLPWLAYLRDEARTVGRRPVFV
jgi:hypothetical protein